jgi:methylmalonyl-CoA/ethylmalonyl-CoA epimerase
LRELQVNNMIQRIDHVSIAVRDYKRADNFFTKLLGLVPGGAGKDEHSKYMFQIYSAGDLSRLEIIAPTGSGSFLDNFLKEREGGVHHITFQVPDIKAAKRYLDDENIPYFGYNDRFENWKELFIHPSTAFGVLIQFAEFNPHEWISESETVGGNKQWEVRKSGREAVLSILHPGGGKADTMLSGDELDSLIADLQRVRKIL